MAEPQRIAKYLARAGICSRREAERLIEQRVVTVDGKTLDTPATLVTGSEVITVKDKVVNAPEETSMWVFHKPKGVITSSNDPQGRKTVFDCLPNNFPRVVTIGRLDFNTEGLLLLTNNGELARYFENPKSRIKRTYRVRVIGMVTEDKLDRLRKGIRFKDPKTGKTIQYDKMEVQAEGGTGKNSWLTIAMYEGKNREIRNACSQVDLTVNRLIRTHYGEITLGTLPKGDIAEIPSTILKRAAKGFAL